VKTVSRKRVSSKQLILSVLFCSLLIAQCSLSWAAIAVVQSVGVQAAGVSSITTSPNINTTSGNMMICDGAYYLSGQSFNSMSDNKSNVWPDSISEVASSADSDSRGQQRFSNPITGGSGHNFTMSFTGTVSVALACKEVSGQATSGVLDRISTTNDNGGNTGISSGLTAATTQANELLAGFGFLGVGLSDEINFTATGGFTANVNLTHFSGGAQGLISASRIDSTIGQKQFTFDMDASPDTFGTVAGISTWKASGAAPVVKIRRRPILQ